MGFDWKRAGLAAVTGGTSEVARFGNKMLGKGIDAIAGTANEYKPEQVDPRLTALRDKQIQRAEAYRKNLPGYKQEQYGQAEEGSRGEIRKGMQDVTRGMNARGLLYSGLAQGQRAGVGAQAASNLAAQKGMINQNIENTADQFDAQAAQTAGQVQSMQQQFNDAAYNRTMQERLARQANLNALGSAVGSLAGKAIGAA